MSGLDLNKMDLFAKKTPKMAPKPIDVMPATPKMVEEAIQKFDEEVVVEKKVQPRVEVKIQKPAPVVKNIIQNESRAKFDKFVPVTARISENEYMELKRVENQIMRNRSKGNFENRERITFNSVVRCLISNFLDKSENIDLSEINNEAELNERIRAMFQ
jgi:hypothetical protein